jgi:uroporphyrinogen-III synthase/uroporphyrinogen III methyltransferase/synthase
VSSLSLEGRRVLVTRSAGQTAKLSDGLRTLGAIPVEVPVLEIVPPESYTPLDEALTHLDRYDWLVLTSTNTLREVSARCSLSGVNPIDAKDLNVAAVGRATAEAARELGFRVAVVPDAQMAEGLVAALGERVRGKRVLLPRAAVARDLIPDALREAGAEVDVVEAYRNVVPEAAPEQLRHAMVDGIDAATFTSSSSVTHLAEAARIAEIGWPIAAVAAVSIGPITSRTLRDLGWEPAVEANPSDVQGLIAAVVRLFSR